MDQIPWYRRLFSRGRKIELKALRAKADQGDVEAQFALGLKYGHGDGELQDLVRSAEWYRKASEQNHPLAQFNLGLMYAKGEGVPQDDTKAVMWIRKAADQGDAGAQFNLGMRYHRASVWGVQLDALEANIEAYKWLRLAAAQGNQDSFDACERMVLGMTPADVEKGKQGVAVFVLGKPSVLESQ